MGSDPRSNGLPEVVSIELNTLGNVESRLEGPTLRVHERRKVRSSAPRSGTESEYSATDR